MTAKVQGKTWIQMCAVVVLSMMAVACGEDTAVRDQTAIGQLEKYYESISLPKSWVIETISVPEEGKLVVDVVVESDDDVIQIKSRSRMLQFFIAKQGCPNPKKPGLEVVEKSYRVWMRLWSTKKEELTYSICPNLNQE